MGMIVILGGRWKAAMFGEFSHKARHIVLTDIGGREEMVTAVSGEVLWWGRVGAY